MASNRGGASVAESGCSIERVYSLQRGASILAAGAAGESTAACEQN